MSSLKPITLYSHESGPNPWKVAILLQELGIPYENEFIPMNKMHAKPYTDINPNGRVPAIVDPNTGVTLWESGAILEYLQETYDKSNQFQGSGNDKFLVKTWLHFQMSGQGPYYGQAIWFQRYHPEKIESAVQRYQNEAIRVIGVLNEHLKGKTYLVAEKCTIADLSFLPWNSLLPVIFGDDFPKLELEIEKNYPEYHAWNKKLMARPAVKKAFAEREAALAKMSH